MDMWLQTLRHGRTLAGTLQACRTVAAHRRLCSSQPPKNAMELLYNRIKVLLLVHMQL